MKIKKISTIHHEKLVPVYDVINADPLHNFIIKTNESSIVSHNCALDEVNFLKAGTKDVNLGKNHMRSLYNTANARITGTFRLRGKVYGKLFVCSSKNTDDDYLSDHIEEQLNAGNTHLYLFDKPQWEVLPKEMFSDEVFYITVGDRYKRGFVIPHENEDEEHFKEYEAQGFKIMKIPKDYETNFRADYDIALRDIAGVSVAGAMGFITQESITPCVAQDRQNPFFQDIISVGVHDTDTIESFFHIEVVPPELKKLTYNIHIDFSETSDKTGISAVGPDGTKIVFDHETEKKIVMPYYRQLFQVAIQAPPGDRLSFQKVINFIIWLRRNGFHVNIISTDQYQSSYVRENLEQKGFATEKISVDRSEDPYISLRNLLQDQRIELVKHQLQEDELVKLQRLNNRIDHPPKGCFTEDTQIQLVDGRSISIHDLLIEQSYKSNWVYTINEDTKKVEPKKIKKVFQSKLVSKLVRVTLDSGESITCTPDHRFMTRDGKYEEIQNLHAGDSLMPLYTRVWESDGGYRQYYEPVENSWKLEHISFCAVYDEDHQVIHHKNFNKLDNRPSNLEGISISKHKQIHNKYTVRYEKVSASVKEWWKIVKNDQQFMKERRKKLRDARLAQLKDADPNYIEYEVLRQDRIHAIEEMFGISKSECTYSEWMSYSTKYSNSLDKDKTYARYASARSKVSEESESRRRKNVSEKMKRMQWWTNGADNMYIDPAIVSIPDGFYRGRCKKIKNHKIATIEVIHKVCHVYDLEIEDNHNFALACGVFVHNSKDAADALCGACFTCIEHQDQVKPRGATLARAISNVNNPMNTVRATAPNLGLSNRSQQRSDPRMPQVFAPGIRRL